MIERIGNLQLMEEIAAGGMAVVYKAFHDGLKRPVALKALDTTLAFDGQLLARFRREAQSLAALQHENIVGIYDFIEIGQDHYIVMEYVEGTDLYDLLADIGTLPFDIAAIIAMQVARALEYVHYRGIIHRDVKPANVMLSHQGVVKLMDFGIARDPAFEDEITQAGHGVGTPSYMSPEQTRGEKLDGRSDLFALGTLLYQMVTGHKPFAEDDSDSVILKIQRSEPTRVRRLAPHVPRELERIINRCLRKVPRERYQSAQALVVALQRFLTKHVEINLHARLVLFLRDSNKISELQANDFLNPAAAGAVSLSQSSSTVRSSIRHGLWLQSVVAIVMTGMVGLIHLAPIGIAPAAVVPPKGYVRIVVNPWGRVHIGGQTVVTPHAAPVEVPSGSHQVVIEHDEFAPYTVELTVPANSPGDPIELHVDLDKQANTADEAP